jgi:hypothetical protein
MNKKNTIIILALISLFLLFFIFYWGDYLVKNGYIIECFDQMTQTNQDRGTPDTSHTVNQPINTTSSCNNFCGPTARCSITGQQCTADIDCPGCQPYVPPLPPTNNCVPGENDAGKLTLGVTPTFSTLTTDIGTQARLYTNNKLEPPVKANFGIDTWTSKFDEGNQLYHKRYQCNNYPYLSHYDRRFSDTGAFVQDGPLASNAYLHDYAFRSHW